MPQRSGNSNAATQAVFSFLTPAAPSISKPPRLQISTSVLLLFLAFPAIAAEKPRCSMWIDVTFGEPVSYAEMLDDLAAVRVVYLGERHTLVRHHEVQAKIVADLASRRVPLVLAMEQMDTSQQQSLDRYAQGQITFEQLAEATQWANRWPGYAEYRPVLEAARKAGAAMLALNARSETIRQVARSGGVAKLGPELRRELPAEMQLADPPYEKLLSAQMMVHAAATPERLRPMIEAQIARDEMMSSVLAAYLQSEPGRGRTAVVLCGAGHVTYGLGTAARVRRRIPDVKDRIVLMSESGDVQLSPAEKAVSRPITITHEQLRALNLPVADYLHAIERQP